MLITFKTAVQEWARQKSKAFPENETFKILTMCKRCYAFYYKNSWHSEKPDGIDYHRNSTIPIRLTRCGACLENDGVLAS